ncbi:flavodoxin family protein [Bacteroidota bacterium]
MNITIYNAAESGINTNLDKLVQEIHELLLSEHQVSTVKLRHLNLNYCNGCWGCWVKTPGQCIIQDDMELIHRSFIQSDLVIFAAQMRMGFPSALLKKVHDRLIPLMHPYIELVNGECHHLMRYEKYPLWGLILEEEEKGDAEDIKMVSEIYERTALNIRSSLLFTCTASQSADQIVFENNLADLSSRYEKQKDLMAS